MTDGCHYRIDFVTFSQILGFGRAHRTYYSRIHDENCAEISDISYMWGDPRIADGRRSGLQSFYYVMNNLIRSTINPKDGADINGYARNVLAHLPDGDKFNVPHFIWVELSLAMDDRRRGLPYAPYLMFMIERVTGLRFPKDVIHTVYKIEKTKPVATTTQRARSSYTHEDIPEGSHSRSRRSGSWKKIWSWMKAIFGKCSYTAERAYDTQREQRELQGDHLPPLPPVPPPLVFDLPSLSDTDDDDD
jgi:hypothetical protein